jgi:hypothetical protein
MGLFGPRRIPQSVYDHRHDECVMVGGATYHQDTIANIRSSTVDAIVGVAINADYGTHDVRTKQGSTVGWISPHQLERAGYQPGDAVTLEVVHPKYLGENTHEMYLPRTENAIQREEHLKSLRWWINVNEDKWGLEPLDAVANFTYSYPAQLVEVPPKGKGKPSYAVMVDGVTAFTITSRMNAYKMVIDNLAEPLRYIDVDVHDGKYGRFYKIGMRYI